MNPALSLFRFYLAMCVVASHFAGPDIWGDGAVEAFFCISGFLVTMIATGSYAGRPRAYLLNRALRIYPVYWACLGLSALLIALFPLTAINENHALALPASVSDFVPQLAIFGLYQGHPIDVRMLPPAWSLNVELYFYLVVGLFTATSPRLTALLAAIALGICIASASKLLPLPYYGDPIGNAQPFFFGSLAYHLKDRVQFGRTATFAVALAFAVVHLFPSDKFLPERVIITSLLAPNLIVAIWTMPLNLSPQREEVFDLLGKLSYPVFLLHWVVAIPIAIFVHHHLAQFAIVAPLTIATAFIVHYLVERPIEALRKSIRSGRAVQIPNSFHTEPL